MLGRALVKLDLRANLV